MGRTSRHGAEVLRCGPIGRFAAALAIAGFVTALFVAYLPFEDCFVARTFGEPYHAYRGRTPMLIGRPRAT